MKIKIGGKEYAPVALRLEKGDAGQASFTAMLPDDVAELSGDASENRFFVAFVIEEFLEAVRESRK